MGQDAHKENPNSPDPATERLRRIEVLRKKAVARPPAEGGGWLMGFSVGFAEGLKHRGTSAPPKLPPPLSQIPPHLAWEKARSRSWESAWEILLEAGLDLGVHFVGEGEERVALSPSSEESYATFVFGYEEGLLVGFAMGKHFPDP